MWEKDPEARDKIGVNRYNSFAQKDKIFSILKPDDKDVTIFLSLQSIGVILTMSIYGDEQSIVITNNNLLVKQFSKEYAYGFVYIISPLLGKYSGPHGFLKYIIQNKHKMNS